MSAAIEHLRDGSPAQAYAALVQEVEAEADMEIPHGDGFKRLIALRREHGSHDERGAA